MTCDHVHLDGSCVIVCRPHGLYSRAVRACPTCARRRRFVVGPYQAYYAPTWTCCACGDSWSEEGRMPRPFARGWRTRAQSEARRQWDQATTHKEAIRSLMDAIA